ncbi:hypothetical protein LTR17_008956 [Elasticomyces elasticus]|nr:hypothetical protein LTR17_008956 [Elasticomyces elasticus]
MASIDRRTMLPDHQDEATPTMSNKHRKKEIRAAIAQAKNHLRAKAHRMQRYEERRLRGLKVAEREARQQERTKKYLDPRRLDILPARLIPGCDRARVRDYHHIPHRFQRTLPARSLRHQTTLDAIAFLPAVASFLLAGYFVTAAAVAIFAAVAVSVKHKSATPVASPSAKWERVLALEPTCSPIVHKSQAFKTLNASYCRPISGFPGLHYSDNSHVLVVKDGSTIALPIDRSPLNVFMAFSTRRTTRHAAASGSGALPPSLPAAGPSTENDAAADDEANSDFDGDIGEAGDTQRPGGKRKRKLVVSKAAPKNRKKAASTLNAIDPIFNTARQKIASDQAIDWTQQGLRAVGITPDESTQLANRFVDLVQTKGIKNKLDARHEYTPSFERAEHVRELPLYDPNNRLYELCEDDVEVYDHELVDGTIVRAYRLQAVNIRDRAAGPVNLFTLSNGVINAACPICKHVNVQANYTKKKGKKECTAWNIRRRTMLGTNLITEALFPDRDLVIELAKIKVDIMNRMPVPLDVSEWGTFNRSGLGATPSETLERKFIDIVSFVTWKQLHNPTFDLGTLPKPRLANGGESHVWKHPYLGSPPTVKLVNNRVRTTWTLGAYGTEGSVSGMEGLDIVKDDVDVKAAEDYQLLDGYHVFGNLLSDEPGETLIDLKDKKIRAAIKVGQIVNSGLVGYIGTTKALLDLRAELRTRFLANLSKIPTVRGPYNGTNLWSPPSATQDRTLSRGGFVIKPSSEAMRNLDLSGLTVTDHAIVQDDLSIWTKILDRACIAYVLQEMLDSLSRGEGTLQSILAGVLAAQQIELGLLTKQSVLEVYCTCPDAATQAGTEHVCTSCFAIRPCSTMSQQSTTDGPRLLCGGCNSRIFADRSATQGRTVDFAGTLKQKVHRNYLIESKFHKPPWEQDEMVAMLLSIHQNDDDPFSWLDGYANKFVALSHRAQAKHRGETAYHPHNPNFEKPHKRGYRVEEDRVVLHDYTNITLIKECINKCKGDTLPPACIPHLKEAVQLRQRVEGRDPCEGYYDDVADEWRSLERGHDNLRMISLLAGTHSATKLAEAPDAGEITRAMSMERSGVWDGSLMSRGITKLKRIFLTRGEDMSRAKGEDGKLKHTLWTKKEWDQILDCVKQIEQSSRWNRYDLRIPRLGENKLPWLWRRDTCPLDADREYIYNEFEARLRTMGEKCDPHHTTQESPATLFLECVVQWFETGGKCHIFGFTMTQYQGHFANFSIGRHYQQMLADGTYQPVFPGDRMATGFTSLLPKDMSVDYDITRRTVIVESWRANILRFCYRQTWSDLKLMLEQAILDLADTTKWYEAVKSLDQYTNVALPSQYKNKTEWMKLIQGGQLPDADEDDAVEVEEDMDDEEVVYYEHCAVQEQAAQEPTDSLLDTPPKQALEQGKQPSATGHSGNGSVSGESGQAPLMAAPVDTMSLPDTHDDVEALAQTDTDFFNSLALPDDVNAEVMRRLGVWTEMGKRYMHGQIKQREESHGEE